MQIINLRYIVWPVWTLRSNQIRTAFAWFAQLNNTKILQAKLAKPAQINAVPALKHNPKRLLAVNVLAQPINWLSMENVYSLARQVNLEIKLMHNAILARTTVVERCVFLLKHQ